MTAVMPKGVEHSMVAKYRLKLRIVMTAVMPKGVEHVVGAIVGGLAGHVMTAVMPKGVEHFTGVFETPSRRCDDSSDAERR